MTKHPPIDSPADIQESESQLPAYIIKKPDGVFVDYAHLPRDSTLEMFVDRLFVNGARFSGLDYDCFLALLYDADSFLAKAPREICVARDIVRFPPQRQVLYKGVRIIDHDKRAEYVFGPVMIEVQFDDPVYGEPGEDGVAPVVDYVRRTREQPAKLDFDEFVADMWLKGVRFGLDAKTVRDAIENGIFGRMDVAFQREATVGSDADIQEASAALQRDNSPKVLANGRTDLRRFKNRFPHVAKGDPLVKKLHPVPGNPGRKLSGEIIAPPAPMDFDLYELAGLGTYVVPGKEIDLIVAAIDGFLTLDIASNQVYVTEKLENLAGISVRTTGDLSLAVDEFVEHGEVQEGRTVEGRHMTFKSNVYGAISSVDGNILIENNLAGGSAKSQGGNVTISGRATRAVLEAWDGEVRAQFAEGCTIIGKVVAIERAVNCQIVAETLQLGIAEACGIAARNMRVATSDMRRDRETILTVLVPDLADFDKKIAESKKTLAELAGKIEARAREVEMAKTDPEFAKFLVLAERIRQGEIKLTETQVDNWKKVASRFARPLEKLHDVEANHQALLDQRQAIKDEIARLDSERKASGDGVQCEIQEIRGGTVVQTMKSSQGWTQLRDLPAGELKSVLHSMRSPQERLSIASDGNFSWQFVVPESV